jgi:hypothetical protein
VKHTLGTEYMQKSMVDDAIQNGVKIIQPLPAQDGNMDWRNYYQDKEDRTKPHCQYVNDVIENGMINLKK